MSNTRTLHAIEHHHDGSATFVWKEWVVDMGDLRVVGTDEVVGRIPVGHSSREDRRYVSDPTEVRALLETYDRSWVMKLTR